VKSLRWAAVGFAVLSIVIGSALAWVLNSQAGARWAASRVVELLDGKLTIAGIRGTVAGPLEIMGLRYQDAESGVDARVEHVAVDVALRELLALRVHIKTASARGVMLLLGESKKPDEKPFSLQPPIDILLDRFRLDGARVERNGEPLLVVRRADLAGRWTDDGVALRQLEVDSPQGKVILKGEFAEGDGYIGHLVGSFNWQIDEQVYAGELQAEGKGRRATLAAKLSAPLTAQLNATVEQRDTLPWRFELRVPKFDPRSQLLPDSSIESLAANLQGAGDKSVAELRGSVAINGQSVRIEPLRVRMQEQTVKIEALTLIDPRGKGRLNASGDVRLEPKPFVADIAVNWRDVLLPAQWVGQELASGGQLKVQGNLATFSAAGNLLLGPPKQLANITLALNGTPNEIELQRLSIVQGKTKSSGELNANGRVQLKPHIGWQIKAQATAFNPGAFIAGWPGQLDLTLASQGKLEPAGPSATLEMSRLNGTLRRRPISGRASLTLDPNKVIAGTLRLRSGGSLVELTGDHGKAMNVTADFNIATLDDWLPQSSGQLNGRFHITGRWPQLAIAGSAHGRKLAFGEAAVDAVNINADIKNPLHPEGKLNADASGLTDAGFSFANIALDASGSERNHTVALAATDDPLSAELRVTGSRDSKGWSGSIEQLKLAATDIAELALREPAHVSVNAKGFAISESCLAGNDISLCLEAQQDAAGGLQGSYRIEHLPLAWIMAMAKPDLPFALKGALEGRGQIRRTPAGALFGEAHLSSPAGGANELGNESSEALLSYRDFKADATLNGNAARVTTSASLSGGNAPTPTLPRRTGEGVLSGEVLIGELLSAAPTLQGNGDLTLSDLSPVTLFTPQLADVKGHGEAHVELGGTLKVPQITGSVRILEFAAEAPTVGIKLREGELEVSLKSGDAITLAGHVASGDGRLDFNGSTTADGVLHVKAAGKDFLAADIPAARIVITPDLELMRTDEQMFLGGKVQVPHAAIDITKLPKGGARQPSSDVVVIDDENAVRKSRGVPLYVTVTVLLGSDVKLVGFGLDSTLTGQLVVHEAPNEPTIGSGEIRVAGTYKAYGQDLTIQQGSLLYAATPLDNPQVSIVAVRTVTDVTAKLSVTGSAQRPLLSVSSDTAMSQTEALSYLVTGKPLNSLGAGEGDVVQSAARSLGGAAGNLLAKNLGKRIGVDELGVQNSEEIGGSAFTIGQYLSPRLYLSYGVGLFEPGQVVTLRYRISNKVSLEASQGPLNQRAGVTYKVEK